MTPYPPVYLSPGARKILALMADETCNVLDRELVVEGRVAWVGLRRTSNRIVFELLALCLISCEDESERVRRYALNGDGLAFAKDSSYVPMIVRALRTGKPQYGEATT